MTCLTRHNALLRILCSCVLTYADVLTYANVQDAPLKVMFAYN